MSDMSEAIVKLLRKNWAHYFTNKHGAGILADQILALLASGWVVNQTCMNGPMPKECCILPVRACVNCTHWADEHTATIQEVLDSKAVKA